MVLVIGLVTAVLAVLTTAVVASGAGDEDAGRPGRIDVVATTTQAADLVRNVAGAHADVVGLLSPNADPHDYELRPHDMKALTRARLVVRSGGDVDAWLGDAVAGAGSGAPTLDLIRHVAQRRTGAALDPHWWQDPRDAVRAVAAIRDALARTDPAHAAAYRTAAARYTARLTDLDRAAARCWAGVPEAERVLVTTHDALGYYARRYGLRVVGAVIPSLSTAGQPSAGELAALVRTIRARHVHAVFAEESVNPKVEEAIAADSGARVGAPLWADALGPRGSSGATYASSIAANTRALVSGLTAGRRTCELPGAP
jgi:zinc/manganese transport system substrate-binding protein